MDGMSELEYWQNMAKFWEDRSKRFEVDLKNCRETNDMREISSDDTTQNMVVAKLKLFTLKSRIQEANNLAMGRMKAAQIGWAGVSQKTPEDNYADGYNRGLSEGTARTIEFVTELYRKAIDTNEPLS